jgi:ATP-dependent Lon protease
MNPVVASLQKLKQSLESNSYIPQKLKMRAYEMIARSALAIQLGTNMATLEQTEKYIGFIGKLPWGIFTKDNDDINHATAVMESRHYGLPKVKERVLQYLASHILISKKNPDQVVRAPSLFFVGLAGTGKTTFARIIAESLGRKFVRIPFGGLANSLDLRGQSKTTPYAMPGIVMRSLAECGSSNPVILLDEIDRINPDEKSAIMGALLEILDPSQNQSFADYYVDYPFDLSQVMFVATANNSREISTAVMDRLEVVQMPSYDDNEKIMIAKKFILPEKMLLSGLDASQFAIDEAVWTKIVRPLGFEPGIRSLERIVESMIRKTALKIVTGQVKSVSINESNLNQFVDATFAT